MKNVTIALHFQHLKSKHSFLSAFGAVCDFPGGARAATLLDKGFPGGRCLSGDLKTYVFEVDNVINLMCLALVLCIF